MPPRKSNVFTFSFLLLASAAFALADFHVSPTGKDTNPGTSDAPFATIARARDAVRTLKSTQGLPQNGVTIWLRGGQYELTSTLVLDGRDSGAAGAPITYAAYAGERVQVTGARALDPARFQLVVNASPAWARLDAAARGQVYVYDLRAAGLSDFGTLKPKGYRVSNTTAAELFINGRPGVLSRWPNIGEPLARTGTALSGTTFTYSGDRPSRWAASTDVWVQGLWEKSWADFSIPVASINPSSRTILLANAPREFGLHSNRPFWVFNVLEELDTPGEYYIDRSTGLLYVWPVGSISGSRMQLSLLETPLVQINNACYIAFKGLVFEAGRGHLVDLQGGNANLFQHCLFRNNGQIAVRLGGTNNVLDACEIADAGEDGVRITGGVRPSLTAAGNVVRHSRISRTGRTAWTYHPPIYLAGGCGNSVLNNLIEDVPHAGIIFDGNNHKISQNELRNIAHSSSDVGALYTAEAWACQGTVISENYIHHVATGESGYGVYGVYLDDGAAGVSVLRNIFHHVQGTAVFVSGGRDNTLRGNVVADSGAAHYNADRGRTRINNIPGDGGNYWERLSKLGVNYKAAPWSTAFPALARVPSTFEEAQSGTWRNPEGCVFSSNIGWRNVRWTVQEDHSGTGVFSVYGSMADNQSEHAPLFGDEVMERSGRPVTLSSNVPNFVGIPFRAIGPASSASAAKAAPDAPRLAGRSAKETEIELTWTDYSNLPYNAETGFEVQLKVDAGAWSTIDTLAPETVTTVITALQAGRTYSFRIKAVNAAGSSYSNEVQKITPAIPLVPGPVTRLEVELPLNVVADVGTKGAVRVADALKDSGKSVTLYDVGDAIQISVQVPRAGTYKLSARVRSGGSVSTTDFWPNGYSFKLDTQPLVLTGDPLSVSTLDTSYGGCVWGTMTSAPLTLSAGSHVVQITAGWNWAVADYIELIEMVPQQSPAVADAGSVAPPPPASVSEPSAPAAPSSQPDSARFSNLSMRARIRTGDNPPIAGFVVGGTGSATLLLRGNGPSLTRLGVPAAVRNPSLRLYQGNTPIAFSDDWTDADSEVDEAMFLRLGVPYEPRDAALRRVLHAGAYTTHLTSSETDGVGQIELFEQGTTGDTRLLNISGRAYVGNGDDVLIIGFIVSGSGSVRVLIRGLGPALKDLGVPDALANPILSVHSADSIIAENDDWAGNRYAAAVEAACAATGATPFGPGSLDAAVVLDLAAGGYTAKVSGVNGLNGTALLEVYQL